MLHEAEQEKKEAYYKQCGNYGIPDKIVSLIKNSYDGITGRVVHNGQLSDSVEIKSGVCQRCLLSPTLFVLMIDWIMEKSMDANKNAIQSIDTVETTS